MTTLTNVFVIEGNRQRNGGRVNHVHRNAGSDGTSGGHLISIGRSGICRHRQGSVFRGDNVDGRASTYYTFTSLPRVGDILVAETVEVGIQHHRSAGTHILLGSIDLQVATQLINRELGRGLATILLGGRHSIDTRNCGGLNIRF